MTGGLGQPHVARDNGAIDLRAEVFQQLAGHLGREVVSGVIHGAQQPFDPERWVEEFPDLLDGVEQRGQPFQGVIFTLHGDQHGIGRDQRVHGQHIERGRAVNKDKIIRRADRRQPLAQTDFTRQLVQQRDLGPGQIGVGGQQIIAALPGPDDDLRRGLVLHQQVIAGDGQPPLVDAAAHGRVALRVHIRQQHPAFGRRERGGQVDAGGGLADAAFLIGDGNNAGRSIVTVCFHAAIMPQFDRAGSRPAAGQRQAPGRGRVSPHSAGPPCPAPAGA